MESNIAPNSEGSATAGHTLTSEGIPGSADLDGPHGTFYRFTKLPSEVRGMVWGFTFVPRVVPAEYKIHDHNDKDPSEDGEYTAEVVVTKDVEFGNTAPLPVALLVCQESRKFAEIYYPKCFATLARPAGIPFSFEIDTLFLDELIFPLDAFLFDNMSPMEISGIRFLSFENYLPYRYGPWLLPAVPGNRPAEFRPRLEKLTALKETSVSFHSLAHLNLQDLEGLDESLRYKIHQDQEGISESSRNDPVFELSSTFPRVEIEQYNLQPEHLPTGAVSSMFQKWVRAWPECKFCLAWYTMNERTKAYCS